VRRKLKHYNLDAIISVAYQVNTKLGIQFRTWAIHTLRDHLLRGYTLNEKRLREKGLGEIEQAVGLLPRTLTANARATESALPADKIEDDFLKVIRLQESLLNALEYRRFSRVSIAVAG
jgi:hypothetical protein